MAIKNYDENLRLLREEGKTNEEAREQVLAVRKLKYKSEDLTDQIVINVIESGFMGTLVAYALTGGLDNHQVLKYIALIAGGLLAYACAKGAIKDTKKKIESDKEASEEIDGIVKKYVPGQGGN